ncbi:ATP-binding protein [Paracoccus sp. PARArs4]|uniref:ATP-binding protein n=1 Tax=Paracoccus sp. PARArs4 TaxID=2853442 RepID=UPI0024A680B0|nr:ATP-binding protein [Paracoccus sp. PARArs4]
MRSELDKLRTRFGAMLVLLFWAHVPVMALAATMTDRMPVWIAGGVSVALAVTYQLAWRAWGIAPRTRYLAAVALVAQPAMLLLILRGHPWQMDMHMYFFALLALNLGWFDRGALLAAAIATTLHHLVLSYVLPSAVFSNGGEFGRVMLHGGIVAFQTVVLLWVRDRTVDSFVDLSRVRDELAAKGRALQERTTEAEAATRTKSMFLANMSHEIRTPINAVLGFCHLLQRSPLDDRQRDQLGKIASAGTALLRLVNDLLDFSKNEAGKLLLERHEFDLRAAISGQAQLMAEDMRNRGLDLCIAIDDDVPALMLGDELRLNQVMLNLLSNAIKFSEDGTIAIHARLAERDGDLLRLEVSVRDCGIGMTEDQIGRLFAPFTQADATTTRRFGGTGLGLTICRQIVTQMQGWIRADSRPGEGSAFTFSVMLEAAPPRVVQPRPEGGLEGRRVLLVEDNPINREIALALLTEAGLEVDCAEDGQEAIEKVWAQSYAAVLMDLQMPRLDGLTATRRIRLRHDRNELPIIAMTSHTFDEEGQRCLEAGMNDHVSKPVDPDRLIRVLMRHVGGDAPAAVAVAQAAAGLPPALPPFDLDDALRRLGGRQALLRKLIGDFARDHADTARRLILELEADRESAHRLAHSLKGVSASLGLPDLAIAAGRIETAIAKGEPVDPLMPELVTNLEAALAAANSLAPVAAEAASTGDPAQAEALRQKLSDLIRRRSLTARHCFDELADALQVAGPARASHPLSLALQRLDYAAAAALVGPFPSEPGN